MKRRQIILSTFMIPATPFAAPAKQMIAPMGVTADGKADCTQQLQQAIETARGGTLTISDGTYLISKPLNFKKWSGKVVGNGIIKCAPSVKIPVAIDFSQAQNVEWDGVELDMGQSTATTEADARCDSGFYMRDARDCKFSNIVISNVRVGKPIYVDGESSNNPTDANGSRNISFNNIKCIAHRYDTVDHGTFVNVRSDFYVSDGDGQYFPASNACRKSDYTLEPDIAYKQTTQNISFYDCHFENFDRFALYNVRGVKLARIILRNFFTRGLTCSPCCEDVEWTGGEVSGNAAQINVNYASKRLKFSNITANGGPKSVGQRHSLRVGFGSSDVVFNEITGQGNDTRLIFIEGAKSIKFTRVRLNNWPGGATTVAASISGGGIDNRTSWITNNIIFDSCDLTANYGLKIDDYNGSGTVATGAVKIINSKFNVRESIFNGKKPEHGEIEWDHRPDKI